MGRIRFLNKYFLTTLLSIGLISFNASAADVPSDVKLAKKQVVRIGNGAEPDTLDPNIQSGTNSSAINYNLFEGLTNQGLDGEPEPGVAESWKVNESGTVYTFKLRKDAKWSDGKPVTAEDFVYSWQRLVNPETGSPYATYLDIMNVKNASDIVKGNKKPSELGVRALDPHTFEVTLTKPTPYMLNMISFPAVFPVPKETIEKYGVKWTKPGNMVSNGAYKLSKWVVNSEIVLERNDQYWNNGKTVINKAIFYPISGTNEINRYRSGEEDMTYNPLPVDQFKKLQQDYPSEVTIAPWLGTYYYNFDTKKPPFDNKDLRKALSYSINRDAIVKFITGRGEKAAYTFTPVSTAGFKAPNSKFATMSQAERDKMAKEFYKKAGYGPDKELQFTLLYDTKDPDHKKIAQAIASMWQQTLGVKVKLEAQEWKQYLQTTLGTDYDVARSGWIGDYNEPSTFLSLLTTHNGQNRSHFSDKKYDDLFAQASLEKDPAKRAKLYTQLEEIIIEEAPVAPIYQYASSRLVKPYLKGVDSKNNQDIQYVRNMYIVEH
ncbi:oligopeptide ABC transporter substrate-binding protein OppA [Paraphotobacterium marinum]|uniref:Oligopeptide ABC transporter substrate-binding protein OppA n=1 Tax=Paraphotobacterium marinum TaxID=1755811 RepID=A0A220VFN1_9GAMM|nr:peptide ABC transporter substrate-binding protein [Paraphotobacterium marinum]ASK79111.1 oligopeptide ABC transporter substrate-binding protein OppA [Paraphotobacterium marinum]